MHLTNVINLAQQGESQTVEFKTSMAEKDRDHSGITSFNTNIIAKFLRRPIRVPTTLTVALYPVKATFPPLPRDGAVSGALSGAVNLTPTSLLQYIGDHPGQRTQAMADAMATPRRTFQRTLKKLLDANQIEFIGSPKTGGYYATNQTRGTPQ
jgi:hypothetical protein